MDYSNKKLLLLVTFVALAIIALGLYALSRNRATSPPFTTPPVAAPPVERPLTEEDKMNILQQLSARTVSVAERKSILDAIMK